MSTVQKVAKNTVVTIAGNVVFRLISLVVIIYLARYLGTAGFGKYNFVFAYIAFFDIITDLGLQVILVREMSRDQSTTPKLIGNVYVIKLILTVFAVVLAITVTAFMPYPTDTTTCIYIAVFTVFFLSLSDFYAAIFQANLRMGYNVAAKLVSKGISAGLIFWIIFTDGTLIHMMIALLFSEMVKALLSYYLFSRKFATPQYEIDFELWKYLFKEALPIALSSAMWVIYYRIDVIMLSMMMGEVEVGLYSAAYKLCEPFSLIPYALTVSLFPVMSAYFKTSDEALAKSYRLGFKYLLIVMLPIAMGISLLSDKLILLIYGTEFAGSAIALKILIWGLAFASSNAIFGKLLTSIGKQKLGMYTTVLCAFGNITLNFILIPLMGYVGASIASVMTVIIIFTVSFYFVSMNFRVLPLHKISIKPIVGSLMMGVSVYFLNINIFLSIFLGAVIYLISLLLLKTFTEEDIDVIKKVTGRDLRWVLKWKIF